MSDGFVDTLRPAAACADAAGAVGAVGHAEPTHWMDQRGLVVTSDWLANDPRSSSDWRDAYNVPCQIVRGKVKPMHPCGHCGGTGVEPGASGDCDVCGKSGGLPTAARGIA